MDPAACRVVYIDDRFNTERWISREGSAPLVPQRSGSQSEFNELPSDLQTNVNAFLSVFNQVFVCRSGRSFSTKLSELHEQVKHECTPILACFDVGSESKHNHFNRKSRFSPGSESPLPSPSALRRELTFSSESDESYGLQLLSRIASDLQVEEGVQLIIPVAIVQPKRRDSYDVHLQQGEAPSVLRAPYGPEKEATKLDMDPSDSIDPQMMLQCLDAGALDVVRSPLNKAGIMGLTVHAYRIYKKAKNEQKGFMASARRRRKQSWVGVEDEKPYAYLREAMVKKLLKGICDPQNLIEDYQHRDLFVLDKRKTVIAQDVGKWSFCGHDFSEDELVYAGYEILNHALSMPQLEQWRIPKAELLRFMQGCQVAYNSFVLYHNFRHAVDVLQSLFYFLVQIGAVPPYPPGAEAPPLSHDKSPIAKLIGPFEAITLLISAIGHDVGHPGVNNMFLVKLNAPLAQLYNDQSVLEAFHCAAYSQILRRHWPVVFHDKALRKLMISSILATDMGVHSEYMQQLGQLQEKIHESQVTDGWSPKDLDTYRNLACGLLIKCADISNVARPWSVAEKWTHLLQEEFANQGEMEAAVGMETTLFGGPPEIGNMLKLANGQIGFMTIFAHPLFANVTDIIPAMSFAADEILTNKGVWFTRAEQEKKRQLLKKETVGNVSPRSRSPIGPRRRDGESGSYFPNSPLRGRVDTAIEDEEDEEGSPEVAGPKIIQSSAPLNDDSHHSSLAQAAAIATPPIEKSPAVVNGVHTPSGLSGEDTAMQAVLHSPHLGDETTESPRSQTPLKNERSNEQANPDNDANALEEGDRLGAEGDFPDTRRDTGVSMRAGSASLPVVRNGSHITTQAEASPQASPQATHDALSKFSFATSDQEEPVRTFTPNQNYVPEHPENRASAPMADIEHEKQKAEETNHSEHAASAKSESTTIDTLHRGGTTEGNLTPTRSTTATSYTTNPSEQTSPTPKPMELPPSRDRNISAPLHSPLLKQTYSLSSDQSSHREGSKNDIRTTIFANGDVLSEDPNDHHRKISTRTIGRRRSRMKLKDLAFWKKNKSDKNVNESAGTATG